MANRLSISSSVLTAPLSQVKREPSSFRLGVSLIHTQPKVKPQISFKALKGRFAHSGVSGNLVGFSEFNKTATERRYLSRQGTDKHRRYFVMWQPGAVLLLQPVDKFRFKDRWFCYEQKEKTRGI